MTELSQAEANQFNGRVIPSNLDFQNTITDVSGSHDVWYPASQDDVATAIKLSKNQKTFVRSGKQVARQDEVDGSDGVVINLSELVNVTINGNKVVVEAAATSEDIVEHLIEHSLVLPLSDDPLKSIASNVINESLSYLTRSLGSLPGYISEIKAVKPDGTPVTFPISTDQPYTGESCLALRQESRAIITQVTFEAVPAQSLWMQRFSFPYTGYDEFLRLAQGLFLESDIPENCDLVLDFYSGSHLIPVVSITALGVADKGKSKLETLIAAVVSNLPFVAEVLSDLPSGSAPEILAGSDVLEAIADAGQGAGLDPTIYSERLHSIETADQNRADFIVEYVNYIHSRVSYRENGEGKLHPDLEISARLQINRDNALEVTGYAYTPRLIESTTTTILAAAPESRIDIPLHDIPLTPPLTLPAPPERIPGFKGLVYQRGDARYEDRAKVYATTSYPAENVTPLMVAYPLDKDDIVAAINYAKKQNPKLHIVARSGGHQYSGKSSGGQQTIVLSMDAFNHLRVSGNIAEVGPAVKLTDLAAEFKTKNITIPHGECPMVAIGGHAQTGGYGHLVRNFGLALDHVEEFDIVLADGRFRRVTRPVNISSPSSDEEKLDREIFWGVLGGNAGSFGIVTGYKFKCIKDSDRPNSYGYTASGSYKKVRYHELMKLVQAWSKQIKDPTQHGELTEDFDFMMTVKSADELPHLPIPILLVEALYGNLPVVKEGVITDERLKLIDNAVSLEQSNWEKMNPSRTYGKRSLSDLSNSFVRRHPATTDEGREFDYPYKKRINCTTNALTDDFIQQFVDMVDKVVMKTKGVKLVFQMLMGGGAYQNTESRKVTSIPHRDYVFCFVFDLFYRRGFEKAAEELQKQMQIVVDKHFSSNQEQRVFWGSFGDTDIRKSEIRQMYYDSEEQYEQLQQLKQRVDPKDIFHTTLTVQLPG
ncbi:FAD-binding protein [Nostoc sp. UHCC 0702]|nr:FAD-binding protein [Nostoc sp. UHCC 0702]